MKSGAKQKRPKSGEQNCCKQKPRESDMSPVDGPNFLIYKTPNVLDNSCFENVTTNTDFPPIKSQK